MASHKIGDRVRIHCPESISGLHGREATVISALDYCWMPALGRYEWRHDVEVDGWGRLGLPTLHQLAYRPDQLIPIKPLPTAADILAMHNLPEGPSRVASPERVSP